MRRACRVCAALAQGVGSMSQQVLEGLLSVREIHPAGGAIGGLCARSVLSHCGGAEGRGARQGAADEGGFSRSGVILCPVAVVYVRRPCGFYWAASILIW